MSSWEDPVDRYLTGVQVVCHVYLFALFDVLWGTAGNVSVFLQLLTGQFSRELAFLHQDHADTLRQEPL